MHYFLGVEVKQNEQGIFVSLKQFVREVLKRFKLEHCNAINTPVEVGVRLSNIREGK